MGMPSLRSEPAGARTQDPVIKSHMLYQLSYRPVKNGAHKVEDSRTVVKSQCV